MIGHNQRDGRSLLFSLLTSFFFTVSTYIDAIEYLILISILFLDLHVCKISHVDTLIVIVSYQSLIDSKRKDLSRKLARKK